MTSVSAEGTAKPSGTRSTLALTCLGAAALAAVAEFVLLLGYAAHWHGYGNDSTPDDNTASSDVFFLVFALAGVVAVVTAIVALVKSRRSGSAADRETGRNVLIGFAVAVVAIILVSKITGK